MLNKRAKIGFFIFSLFVMAVLAGGAILMGTQMTYGLLVVGVGCVLAALGFVIKAKVVRMQ